MNNRDIKENMEQRPKTVDYTVYRDAIADNRWVIKRLVVALIVAIALLFGAIALLFANNMAWLNTWNQYDYSSDTTTTTIDSEGNGIANYTGGDGGVTTYGEGDSNTSNYDPNQANSNGDT